MNGSYTLPNGSPASLTVVVTRDATDPWTYELVATATVGSEGDPVHRVTRTNGARVYVRNEYVMRPGAVVANGNATFYGPITATGDVYVSKQMGIKSGTSTPAINGRGFSQSAVTISGYVQPTGQYWPIENTTANAPIAPSNGEVNLYKTYTVNDKPYNASLLDAVTSLLSGLLGILTRQPTADNPAGIIYKNAPAGSPFVLSDNTTIEGTLVVEGDLQVKGANITINPQPGFPALIVTGNVEIFQSGKSLTSNGATYIGGQLKSNGTPLLPALTSTFTVNGGLIFGSPTASPIPNTYNVKTVLNYNATKARAPDLSSALRQPKGVSIVRWGLP
jgi:cytoskeletal protein CcmA (bactofilin family)